FTEQQLLDLSHFELIKNEHAEKIDALEHRIKTLEESKKEDVRGAVGVGFENPEQKDKKEATTKTVAEVLQEKHSKLSDHVIGIVEQLTQKVDGLEKQVTQLKQERGDLQKERDAPHQKTVVASHSIPWHRSLLNVVMASSFLVSGLYYSKALLPFVA